jgi:hypothetical protein
MRTRTAAAIRLALIVILLAAVVCAQAASLEEFHHQSSSHHCCGLCHAGMPFVQSAQAGPIAPVASNGWLEQPWTVDTPHEVLLTAGSSRAPPVSFPSFC